MARKRDRAYDDDDSDNSGSDVFSGRIATPDVERLLKKDGPPGVNIETGWTEKTYGTGKCNDA